MKKSHESKAIIPKTENKVKKPRATKIKHSLHVEISPDKYFVTCDGRRIKDCKELAEILQEINDDIFNYHVNAERNDFSTWIRDVFHDEEISESIKSIHNRIEMRAELYKKLFEKLEKLKK